MGLKFETRSIHCINQIKSFDEGVPSNLSNCIQISYRNANKISNKNATDWVDKYSATTLTHGKLHITAIRLGADMTFNLFVLKFICFVSAMSWVLQSSAKLIYYCQTHANSPGS